MMPIEQFIFHRLDLDLNICFTGSTAQTQKLELIRDNFLRYLSFDCHVEQEPHSDYNGVSGSFFCLVRIPHNLQKECPKCSIFLSKLINGNIDCASLLERLQFEIPIIRTRTKDSFYIKNVNKKKYYLFLTYMFRCLYRLLNSCGNIDKFEYCLNEKKNKYNLKRHVLNVRN